MEKLREHKDKLVPNHTSIRFYKWHSDGTKTLVSTIPNKVYRSKHSVNKMDGYL